MRRFIIYHRRGRNRWRQLQPGVHDDLCARPELQQAIRYMRDNPSTDGIALRLGDDLFNLMAAAPADCYEFTFPEG
jgi:hypothetical protein